MLFLDAFHEYSERTIMVVKLCKVEILCSTDDWCTSSVQNL